MTITYLIDMLVKYYNSFVDNVTSYCTHQIIYQNLTLKVEHKLFFFFFLLFNSFTNQYKLIKTGIKPARSSQHAWKEKKRLHINKNKSIHVDCCEKTIQDKSSNIYFPICIVQWNKSSENRNSPLCQISQTPSYQNNLKSDKMLQLSTVVHYS